MYVGYFRVDAVGLTKTDDVTLLRTIVLVVVTNNYLVIRETSIRNGAYYCFIPAARCGRKIYAQIGGCLSVLQNLLHSRISLTVAFPTSDCIRDTRYDKSGLTCLAIHASDAMTDLVAVICLSLHLVANLQGGTVSARIFSVLSRAVMVME